MPPFRVDVHPDVRKFITKNRTHKPEILGTPSRAGNDRADMMEHFIEDLATNPSARSTNEATFGRFPAHARLRGDGVLDHEKSFTAKSSKDKTVHVHWWVDYNAQVVHVDQAHYDNECEVDLVPLNEAREHAHRLDSLEGFCDARDVTSAVRQRLRDEF